MIMRKYVVLMLLWMLSVTTVSAQHVVAYIWDSDGPYTNIRNAPKGKVIDKISTSLNVLLVLKDYQNGWWRIDGAPENAAEGVDIALAPSKTGHWIHYSVVAFATRNYGGQSISLYSSPNLRATKVYTFSEEKMLHPIGVKGDWIKVTTEDGKHTGWIEQTWICANPLTNCS